MNAFEKRAKMRKCKKCGQEIKGKWSLPVCPDCYMEQIVEEWEKLKAERMSKREVIVCDGCGKIIEKISECYKLNLKTDKFWDGIEYDYNLISLDFCPTCAIQVKDTLQKIAERLEIEDKTLVIEPKGEVSGRRIVRPKRTKRCA